MTEFNPAAYWQERLELNPGLTGVGYTSLGQRFNQWQYKLRRHIFRRAISRLQLDLASANIVDVGSGTGFYIACWKELGAARITGIDITEFAVSRLRHAFPDVAFHRADIGAAAATTCLGQPDVVSCFDVLFHVVDDQRFETALQNIYSALAPGGWFLFSDVFLHSATRRVDHMVSRSLESMEALLRDTGFEILERRPVFVTMNIQLDTRSRLQQFLWKLVTYPASKSELYGFLLGAALYPVDMALTRVLCESPTTELMICRKPAVGDAAPSRT